MEKEGFIYLWYDRYRKMYYLGCHWGTLNDGYICSSNRMRDAYRRRPQDFKRRIIERGIPRKELLEAEFRWLQMIEEHELRYKYYNLRQHHYGHWANDPNANTPIKEKISRAKKGVKPNMTPDQLLARGRTISESKNKKKKERMEAGLPVRKKNSIKVIKGPQSTESKRKKSLALQKAWQEGRNVGTTGRTYEWSEERRKKHLSSVQGCHSDRNPESYSSSGKKAWAEGKFANRKSNNMREYIWVIRISDGTNTRIKKDLFDPSLYIRGKLNKKKKLVNQ